MITGTDNSQVLLWDVHSGKLTQVLHHGEGMSDMSYNYLLFMHTELHVVQVVSV